MRQLHLCLRPAPVRQAFVMGLFLFLNLTGVAKGQQSHYSTYDVALHLQQCTKRPVFFVLSIAEQLTADSLPPCERGRLEEWLSPRKVKLIWTDSVILLRNIPVPIYTSAQGNQFLAPAERWTDLILKVSVRKPNQNEQRQQDDRPEDYKYFAVRRDLNEPELTETGKWILENVPMPPSFPPLLCSTCGLPPGTVSFHLDIVLEAVKLTKDGPEQIVGRISNSNDDGPVFGISRVFLLQNENGRIHLQWISPLLRSLDQSVSYLDVNADGTAAIWSLSGYMAGNREAWALSIFDSEGRELTRTAGDCQLAAGAQGEEATTHLPAACPIGGRPDVEHSLDSGGKVLLKVSTDFPYETQEARTYKLVDGRYVRVKKTRSKQ
jgi:hypothetical protein